MIGLDRRLASINMKTVFSEDRSINFANQLDRSKTNQSELENLKMKTVEKISEVIDKTYEEVSMESTDLKKYEEPDSGIQIDTQLKAEANEPEVKVPTEEIPEDTDIEVKILKPVYPGGAELDDKERLKAFETQLEKTGKKVEKEIKQKTEKSVIDAMKAGVINKTTAKEDHKSEDKPKETPKTTPDKAPKVITDITLEVTLDDTPETEPEITPEEAQKDTTEDKLGSDNIPKSTQEVALEDTPETKSEDAPIEMVKILKPKFPGGAVPDSDRLKDFDNQLLVADTEKNNLKQETEKLVEKTISKKDEFLKPKNNEPEDEKSYSRANEIAELEKLTIISESDDDVTIKLRKFLRFYLDIEIKKEFIFQRPTDFEATSEFEASKTYLEKLEGSEIQFPQVS